MKIYNQPDKKNNYIVTICHGAVFKKNWVKYILPNWLEYCKKNSLGLLMIDKDLIIKKNKDWKKTVWQKLLIGDFFIKNEIKSNNVCYLDNDILINFMFAPNIFDRADSKKISVVSQYKNLPFDLFLAQKKISFNRNKFYSKEYPLDSSIFMKPRKIFKFHNFKNSFDNYFCAGLFIFNVKKHSNFLKNIFYKYDKNFFTITGGDEPVMNYEFQNSNNIKWLDYRFQAIWIFEMATKYSYLYKKNRKIDNEVIQSIQESLISNYFLHFAGSWYESDMWKNELIHKFYSRESNLEFSNYYSKKPLANPKGLIKSNSKLTKIPA